MRNPELGELDTTVVTRRVGSYVGDSLVGVNATLVRGMGVALQLLE